MNSSSNPVDEDTVDNSITYGTTSRQRQTSRDSTTSEQVLLPAAPLHPVPEWSRADVDLWLQSIGLRGYARQICDVHRVDGRALLLLTESDLRQPPLSMCVLGDIKRLAWSIAQLRTTSAQTVAHCHHAQRRHSLMFDALASDARFMAASTATNRASCACTLSSDSSDAEFYDAEHRHYRSWRVYDFDLPSDYFRAFVSTCYLMLVTWITSLVMVIVHERVPDMNKYPPLPDLLLDNLPHIPWAFDLAEIVGSMLFVIWLLILFFHKHRFILFRRFNSLCGTIFLLRCVTMLITSLSVPGSHLKCRPREEADWYTRLNRVLHIWYNAGLSIRGVQSCGDYMFSGHTATLTILNFFISEYTPRRSFYWLHMFTWVLNIFGIFFILCAHEHYSIDIFIAFYITSRLFMYYHTLSNNRVARKRHTKQNTHIWFPMFSYFEANVSGVVPNEFEWPAIRPICKVIGILARKINQRRTMTSMKNS